MPPKKKAKIVAGLQLKQRSHTLPFKTLTYAPAVVYNTPPTVVDWQLLTLYHVEGNHIRIHDLQEDKDLCVAINEYKSSNALAVVVINSEESLSLSEEIVKSLGDIGMYLVAVVSHSDGDTLIQVQNGDEDVFARLENVSSEATPLAVLNDTAVWEIDQISPQGKSVSHSTKRKGIPMLSTRVKVEDDLKAQITKLIFDGGTMLPVSTDIGVFGMVMSHLTQYEKVGEGESTINDLIKTFVLYIERAFHKEFPFFLILAYRLNRQKELYKGEELRKYIFGCINAFESLSPHQVTQTLENFIQKEDFDIELSPERVTSVFQLLATTCHELMSISTSFKNMQNSPGNGGTKTLIYCMILWISVHLKCLDRKGSATRVDAKIWNQFLLTHDVIHNTVINREIIEDFRRGLELSTMLQLPAEVQFTTDHWSRFLTVKGFIRPFSHIRDMIMSLENFIQTEKELLSLMANLRSHFTPFLHSDRTNIIKATVEGTVSGAIDEGISFLDGMTVLWNRKVWCKGPLHEEFRDRCFKWIKLLLDTVCVTEPNALLYFKKFLQPKRRSVIADRTFRSNIVRQILEEIRKSFPSLTVPMFFALYKGLKIYPIAFLHDYLKQYNIPRGVKISDAIWTEFFNIVLERFRSEEVQHHLLEFLRSLAECYKLDQRAKDFIPDLIRLDVPLLFAAENEPGKEGGNLVGEKFSSFLREYIQRNNLCTAIMSKIENILSYVADNEQHNIHCIVLNVLQLEIIPELKALQGTEKEINPQLKNTLTFSVNTLCQNVSWFASLSPRQMFCWGVVATTCGKFPVKAKNIKWVHHLKDIIQTLGVIFNTYCKYHKLDDHQCLLSKHMPEKVDECPWGDVRNYFHWVRDVQDCLHEWQEKLVQYKVNYDEILQYVNHSEDISAVGQAVCANSYIVEMDVILEVKKTFEKYFEQLNVYLLRYVPNHPDVQYCTLPELLNKYGVSLLPELQESMSRKIIFPSDQDVPVEQSLHNVVPPSVSDVFKPGQNISLVLMKSLSLHDLQMLLNQICQFLKPVAELMDMFVFFHLHKSEMFRKHLLKQLQHLTPTSPPPKPEKIFSRMPSVMPTVTFAKRDPFSVDDKGGVSIDTLQKALQRVKELLLKIFKGTSTYSDIIANGALQLETLDVETEFGILTSFESLEMKHEQCKCLEGVRCMLELFQFTHHINKINSVCHQYGLTKCLESDTLKCLMVIVEELESEKSRDMLTLIEAIEKMAFLKKALCLGEHTNYSCLDLFSAIANSAAFYQFIRDKQFMGTRGQIIFREQYQLVTAQLQHEEYDENVLNHLIAAFELIAPFTEHNISFMELMSKVVQLTTTHGLKQLETVNGNIILIRRWFSRTEGDTIENVANELKHIMITGKFQFQLSNDQCNILLIYQPSFQGTSQRTASNVPLEESEEKLDAASKLSTSPTICSSPQPITIDANREESSFPMTVESIEQRWTGEQIGDFVRKLGFFHKEKDGGDEIKQFLHLNSTANKLLELFKKLHELGHPQYQMCHNLPVLQCSMLTVDADAMVDNIEQTLLQWTEKVCILHQNYCWLLFFSVPKLLHLHSLLDNINLDLDAIVRELSFLFENSVTICEKLKPDIQNAIKVTRKNLDEDYTPMHMLGEFLQLVCSSRDLQPFLCKQRSSQKGSVSVAPLTTTPSSLTTISSPQGIYQLHYAPGYTQSQLLRLITEIYDGVPESFEVFYCHPLTTQEELKMFMERVKYHPLPYLILQVNKLPFNLQEVLMSLLKYHKLSGESKNVSTIHFIETSPSVLRQVPWILYREQKEDGPNMSFDEAARIVKKKVLKPSDFSFIELVCGYAGDGKTHYIRQQLAQSPAHLTIAVNEAFTPLNAINCLNTLPHNTSNCAIYFNFTLMLYHGVEQDKKDSLYPQELMETIGWFFFNLLVLGYVEDPSTGASFRFPGGQEWAIYIEVPSIECKDNSEPEKSLHIFCEMVPTLGLLGSPHAINSATPYVVDQDVQLVCKYLRAYKIGGIKGIDRLYKETPQETYSFWDKRYYASVWDTPYGPDPLLNKKVKFSEDEDLTEEECHSLLMEFMPECMQNVKITQKLFVRYMKRRCEFLDSFPHFNYNTGIGEPIQDGSGHILKTDTRQLGSTLMKIMIEEVNNFCDPSVMRNWSQKPHQQLIYDFHGGGSSFGLLSENLPEKNRQKYEKIGFEVHSSSNNQDRKVLDQYLARALGLPLEKGKCLSAIDDSNYVLTLDYTIKMLNIHERYECGVPVIIKGETGVGKTALVEMLSRLWSHALLHLWNKEKGTIKDAIRNLLSKKAGDSLDNYQICVEICKAITSGQEVPIDGFIILGQIPDSTTETGQFYSHLRDLLLDMATNPAVALLKLSDDKGEEETTSSLDDMFELARTANSLEMTARLLHAVLKAEINSTFHKLNVHSALTPSDIKKFFEPVFKQGKRIQAAYKHADEIKKAKMKTPFVTVFLDEVNTSSCLGLFKEIIVDRSLDGESIPENIFIVAACNPHCGNSMATHAEETWLHSSYYVRPLHPTLEYLIWDYGSLDLNQERDYTRTKMQMLHKELSNIEVVTLADLIVQSQSLMRLYASTQLRELKMKPEDVEVSSKSCVSQRDIQRVFTFYQWLMSVYDELKQHGERTDYSRRAVMVSLGIVYYMRLNNEYRDKYKNVFYSWEFQSGGINFLKAFQEELDWFCKSIDLPPGIAKTQALKENLFATFVCTATRTPLIIVGPPGSSKTLSFNLIIANVKGPESKMPDLRNFKSLDTYFYQCSHQTTSNEIQTVFSQAINRQRSHQKFSLPIYSVVFMDEAGLPEESHESLKVLYYHLDKQEVSFVAITNHVLDAAKTNRAVSLFRPKISDKDLEILAKGCWCSTPDKPPPEIKNDLNTIVQFCPAYSSLMKIKRLSKFFGLRDFMHFVNYLRRRRTKGLSSQLVVEALERNFNGVYWTQPGERESFQGICQLFLKKMPDQPISLSDISQRSMLEILQQSLLDRPQINREENEVRYKLIIDPSEDNSVMNLLITFGVIERKKTRIYVCSDFPGDGEIEKINTIAAIRHSAAEGHTVVMSQTNSIHECFYDLFNQRFRRIHVAPDQDPRCFANIAIGAHSKPCQIHKDFVCIVVVKQSAIEDIPGPFLNRFEKYYISHETLLQTAMNHLQPCVRIIVQTAKEKVKQFIDLVGGDKSLYGLKKETLDSLLLSLLPPYGNTYKDTPPGNLIGDDIKLCLLQELLRALRNSAGFAVPVCQLDELEMDAEHIFPLIQIDPKFDGILQSLTVDCTHHAVTEAIHVLHTAPVSDQTVFMSQEASLVISILQHWLICHLCKRLMQLMTPEADILYCKKIPGSLINNYLSHQQHFSLKKLINHHYTALESCQGDMFCCASKLLCFTRSSPIIHQLPTKYPSSARNKRGELLDDTDNDTILISELVCEDPNQVKICKLSSVPSQNVIHEVLKDFIDSPDQKIFLLLANMQEATKDMINHLRVMIEETEVLTPPTTHQKLFVLLLHFPPAMFFDSCYPSVFLRGWNHYYLDSIGHSPTLYPGTIDIEEWFQRCCFPNKELSEDSLMRSCNHLLVDVIPVLASHVSYGTRSCGPFTRNMKATERCNKLKELLIDKGVGKILCKFFRTYWSPHVMVEHLECAAAFTQSQDSSLNLTDYVQVMFQSTFTDFMVVMVTRMNHNRNLDVLFAPDCNPVIENLFLSLLETRPYPKLSQLKNLSASLTQPQPQEYQPAFPFFSVVYNGIEQLIEETRKIKSHEEHPLEETLEDESQSSSQPYILESGMTDLADRLITTVEQGLKDERVSCDPVYIFLRYLIDHSTDLWSRYFSDFIYHSLHVDIVTSSLSCKVMQAFFSEFLELPLVQRIIFLHTYVDYNKNNMGNLSSLLRPLEQVAAGASNSLSDNEFSSPGFEFIKAIQETKHPFGDPQMLSVFVISALFSAIVGAVFPQCEKNEEKGIMIEVLRIWYQTYLRVMSMPALKSHLYVTFISPKEEAMFDIMHCTFVMIHIHQTPDDDALIKGSQVFTTLLQTYFETNLKLKENINIPHLSECMEVTSEMLVETEQGSISLEMSRRLQEELLDHFFSKYRMTYSIEDQKWFLKLVNTPQNWKVSTQMSFQKKELKLTSDDSCICVSMTTYKMFLSRILVYCNESTDMDLNPLYMYNTEARQHIATVLSQFEGKGDHIAGPYIPTFYQDCRAIHDCQQAENPIMQQPLCHLYFFTLMEHLLTKPRDVRSLIRVAGNISQLYHRQNVPLGDKIVLHIEKQAVLQCLLKEVPSECNRNTNQLCMTKELVPVMKEFNDLLDDDSTGGGTIGGHGLTLGMHLLHELQSDRKFTDLFTTRYQDFREINCLSVFHQQLKTQTESSKHYLFPFMQMEDQKTPLNKLYQQVRTAMLHIDEKEGSQPAVDQLLKVAKDCSSSTGSQEAKKNVDRKQAFKMMLWLVTYYDFFLPKRISQPMCSVIGKQLKPYIEDESVIRLIQSFLNPSLLIKKEESSMPLREDTQMLQILPNGHIQQIDHGGEKVDPLYEMFMPPQSSPPNDQSDIDLCHCLGNLVGVVLGCQPQSNHLWYHLFSPIELKNTYMTGFMYDSKISPEGLLYDCGVELTAEGQYGRPDYHKHATRGTYSLHSLYFLLWANFGAFCISLLTQPDSQSKIHGPIISEWQAIRHYCVSQVKTTWSYLRNNLSLSDEERSFLVTRCLMNMYEVNMDSSAVSHGILRTKEEQDEYETKWHTRIYTPGWNELHSKFDQYSVLWQSQVFMNIRQLEIVYPQYPSEKEFLNHIQGLGLEDGELKILSRFVLEKQRLEVGGRLLPDLIQLYQWLHTHLSHLVTRDRAYNKLTIGRVIHLASQRVDPTLKDLYNRVKEQYNQYVELVGGAIGQGACAAVRRGNKIYTIADDLPLVHFLSDLEDEGEGNDWLYAVIRDITETQNLFIQTLYASFGENETNHPLSRLLPSESTHIYPIEANEHNCIIGKQQSHHGLGDFLQLVRSRQEQSPYQVVGSPLNTSIKLMSLSEEGIFPRTSLSFNLKYLQEDIVSIYLSGRPIIKDVSSLRNVFKFRLEETNTQPSDPLGAASDLSSLKDLLPDSFSVPLCDDLTRHLEYEFHSANYHTLTDIVIGLRTALGHLIKFLPLDGESQVNKGKDELKEFIFSQYETEEKDSSLQEMFCEIGIKNLSDTQLACLSSVRLCFLFSTLELFVRWVKEGLYDFNSLPMALKVHLTEEDSTLLEQLPKRFPGTSSQLLLELKELSDILLHIESHLIKEVNEQAQKPLIGLLQTLNLISDTDRLPDIVPNTVLVCHYVNFRMILRRMTGIVDQRVAMETSQHSKDDELWTVYVDDLWSNALPHLREKGGCEFIDSTLLMSVRYGFYGEEWEEESVSELDADLNKDSSEGHTDEDSVHSIYDDQEHILHESENSNPGLEDPHLYIKQQAKNWSPQMVSQFLDEIGMQEYCKHFLEEEIAGSHLLEADREVYQELGVTSAIHCVQIAVKFKRELLAEKGSEYSLKQLLQPHPKLVHYEDKFEQAHVDVEMMLFAQETGFIDELLKAVGVDKALDRNKIKVDLLHPLLVKAQQKRE